MFRKLTALLRRHPILGSTLLVAALLATGQVVPGPAANAPAVQHIWVPTLVAIEARDEPPAPTF